MPSSTFRNRRHHQMRDNKPRASHPVLKEAEYRQKHWLTIWIDRASNTARRHLWHRELNLKYNRTNKRELGKHQAPFYLQYWEYLTGATLRVRPLTDRFFIIESPCRWN
jgi:hypothetical protein